jgi:hypothetical protein
MINYLKNMYDTPEEYQYQGIINPSKKLKGASENE